MSLKKTVCMLAAVSLITTGFSGCGKKETVNTKVTDDPNEKLTITWLSGPPSTATSQEGTGPELILEEKFNIEIKPLFYASEKFNEKKTMLMAAGDIPDLIYELDPRHVQQDVDQGFIMKLPYDMIQNNAPSLFKNINTEAPSAWIYSRVGKYNYGLPNLIYNNAYARPVVWRTDWLKNVHIDKIPESLEEMHTALLKFRNEDPDKNGQKDTYGMGGDIKNAHTTFTEIFGAFGVTPFNWMNVGGKVVYGGFQPGTVEALKMLKQWYAEGIIHPDFITDNAFSTSKDKFVNGIVGYMNQNGGYWDPESSGSLVSLITQLNPKATISNAQGPKGPDGKAHSFVWGKPAHVISFGIQNEKNPVKVVRILKMFETLMNDEELLAKVKMGEKGKTYIYKDESKGIGSGIKFLPPYDDWSQQNNECLTSDFGAPTFFTPFTPSFETHRSYLTEDYKKVYEEYFSIENGMADAFNKPDVLPSSSDYFVDLRTKQINLMVKIIKGEMTIDQYSEFENIWKNEGGLQLEKEASEMSATIETMYNEIGINK